MESTNDLAVLQGWIGETEKNVDVLRSPWVNLMEQTLDRSPVLRDGDPLPPLWHWIYFLSSATLSGLGRDGHPARGGFLPPVALPRRMWAGGRIRFEQPLLVGSTVTKTSTITNVAMKSGSTGDLCFVTVQHVLSVDDASCVIEEQDLVYREDPRPDTPPRAPAPVPATATWTRTISPSAVQLFRYSALTFNGHRIHYDRDYCRDVEGYAGLVFHGPLTATLLADLAIAETNAPLTGFSFRGVAPLLDTTPFTIGGTRNAENPADVDLYAASSTGGLAMQATATFGTP